MKDYELIKQQVNDFCINRLHADFQTAVRWLKQWQHLAERPAKNRYVSKVEPITKDTQAVIKNLLTMQLATEIPYLESRGITKEILASPRFHGRIYKDSRNNVVFPHYSNGIVGYELKNYNFVGFSPNGEKALWFSNTENTDKTLVIAESSIDAISYHLLFPDEYSRFASIGGAMSPKAKDLLYQTAKAFTGNNITLTFDNDEAGRAITNEVEALLADLGKNIRVHLPRNKDFNDDLKEKLGLPMTTRIRPKNIERER